MKVLINLGPTIGDGMLFITVNLIAFLLTLMLVLRIGPGKIAQPIFLIGLGFVFSAFVPIILGIEFLWLVPLVQSLFSGIGIILLMGVLGVWELIREKKK